MNYLLLHFDWGGLRIGVGFDIMRQMSEKVCTKGVIMRYLLLILFENVTLSSRWGISATSFQIVPKLLGESVMWLYYRGFFSFLY